jgi:plastocyanin
MKKIISIIGIMSLSLAICGSISGNVNFDGKGPKKKKLKMDADPVCGTSHQGPVYRQDFVMDDSNNLANVLVYIKNIDYKGETTKSQAVLDQKGCVYSPHVMGVMKGQEILIKNSDATLHNIHGLPKVNNEFNFAMPKVLKEKKMTLVKTESAFKVKCDVHPWMSAYVQVFDHPYFTVSSSDGSFKIDNVPAGTYEVVAWQEKFKDKTVSHTVTVGDGNTNQNFTFVKPSKKK